MNWTAAETIARALLYEGYLLYPYRRSALKNQWRWTFGVVAPGGSTGLDCLFESGGTPRLHAKVRHLRQTGEDVEEREDGAVDLATERLENGLSRLSLRIENRSDAPMLSCHALVGIEDGTFVSSADPRAAVCDHRGLWPVLVAPDLILAAPIILPDYPAVAPESPGDLFDGTEIDEMLTLRILTLSDAEKAELRRGDERARRLLERTEALAPERILALHGARRCAFQAGDRVRLRPRGRADILDLALEGKEATVVAVEETLEGQVHVAVTVADDPGSDLGRAGFPGHRFFFRPEEVERL
jgi:hydrogenase maturation protease